MLVAFIVLVLIIYLIIGNVVIQLFDMLSRAAIDSDDYLFMIIFWPVVYTWKGVKYISKKIADFIYKFI
jgi:TRAP-type mannitol/chloroaromatic compound transport system permease small subunit